MGTAKVIAGSARIITTSLHYDRWCDFLGNKGTVSARLDRPHHRRRTIYIDGVTLRTPQ